MEFLSRKPFPVFNIHVNSKKNSHGLKNKEANVQNRISMTIPLPPLMILT